jgi:hypothetical protein
MSDRLLLSGGGSLARVAVKTGAYTVTEADDVILANTAGSSFTITLFSALGAVKPITIKKTATANTLTIATTSSQTIDGSTTVAITHQYESITVVSDGSNWHVI